MPCSGNRFFLSAPQVGAVDHETREITLPGVPTRPTPKFGTNYKPIVYPGIETAQQMSANGVVVSIGPLVPEDGVDCVTGLCDKPVVRPLPQPISVVPPLTSIDFPGMKPKPNAGAAGASLDISSAPQLAEASPSPEGIEIAWCEWFTKERVKSFFDAIKDWWENEKLGLDQTGVAENTTGYTGFLPRHSMSSGKA
jgi:hypothetical protein